MTEYNWFDDTTLYFNSTCTKFLERTQYCKINIFHKVGIIKDIVNRSFILKQILDADMSSFVSKL